MLLVNDTVRPKPRASRFAGSIVLHCVLICALTFSSGSRLSRPITPTTRKYSVRFLRLQLNKREPVRTASAQGAAHPALKAVAQAREAGASKPEALESKARAFQLPATVQVKPVKQTLVQLDRPPNLPLKQDIALPAMLLWTNNPELPEMRKQFVPPPVRKVQKVLQSLPVAPTIELANREVAIADLKIANTVPVEAPKLVQPLSTTAPVRIPGPQAVKIPDIVPPEVTQPTDAAIISMPESAVRLSELTVLPPANQIAASNPAGSAGSHGNASGSGSHPGSGTENGDPGSAGTAGSGAKAEPALVSGTPSGSSLSTNAVGSSGQGRGTEGRGTDGRGSAEGSSGSGDVGSSQIPGTTRLVLPKEGKFGVVITGAASSAPYTESIGVLSGKVVYTVYLRVGLRKNWILQYCLPTAAEQQQRRKGSATPIQAPWPYLMLRPDSLATGNADYVILHGDISAEGHFQRLGLVFPNELEQKDLLLHSLKNWEFRPASRDGVATEVEFLLIIPSETE